MKPLAFVPLLVAAEAVACPGLEVQEAWIREAPAGAMMTAGYAQLANPTGAPLVLEGAGSPAFDSVEIHRSVIVDGLAKMVQEPLRLPPGATAALEPGSWHLMMFEPARGLKAGETIAVWLQCGTGRSEHAFTVRGAR
jgi:periplasmic copper chaperone A